MPHHSTVAEEFYGYDSETSSRESTTVSLQELNAQKSRYWRTALMPPRGMLSMCGSGSRRQGETESDRRLRKRFWCRCMGIGAVMLTIFGTIAGGVYIALVTALLRRLTPPPGNNGLQHIVETWKEPDSRGSFQFEWRDDFSRNIVPKSCHSHNDYWRAVPLYAALAAGCISVEADIWLTDDEELLVSHSLKSTTQGRTLKSLYLDPLTNILVRRNVTTAGDADKKTGVFDSDPSIAVVLLIDFKSDGAATWPVLLQQLAPLREKDLLTRYDGETLRQGPLTIVGTGNVPFDLIQRDDIDRYIFFDAPLLSVAEPKYNSTNTYYASAPIRGAVGKLWFNRMTSSQIDAARGQVKMAQYKGLKSRYWDTPSWPIGRRDEVWKHLMDVDVGVLSVDDLVSATRWNWGWCIVAGIPLCGNS